MHNPTLAVDHSVFAVAAAQYIANVFVGLARQNSNHFNGRKSLEKHLVYPRCPLYVGNITDTPYEQVYLYPVFHEIVADKKVKAK